MPSSFSSLPLRPELLEAVEHLGYRELTPIQAAALPPMLAGQDVTGRASTGSGKTAAFGLALLQAIGPLQATPHALVLCPTRELADQVAAELRGLAQRVPNTRILALCGGHPLHPQRRELARGAHIVVGTPGRLGKHIDTGHLDLSTLRILVLDEADRLLDMGFIEQVEAIVGHCPAERQTLLFSATIPGAIEALSARVQQRPHRVEVEAQVAPELLQQLVYSCEPGERNQLIVDLLVHHRPSQALVFCETRSHCDRLAAFLSSRGAVALALHGLLEQRDRDELLLQFTNGSASLLVATNVAARGLDIPSLPAVIITELSPEPESHLHRIGRTGRAGEAGLAMSIVSTPNEHTRLECIEDYLGRRIPRGEPPPRGGGLRFLTPPNRTLLILAGRKDKLRRGDVLGALVKDAGLPPEAVGRIDLDAQVCAVAVAREFAQRALDHVLQGRIKKRRVRARLLG